jgi:hypothetical protein
MLKEYTKLKYIKKIRQNYTYFLLIYE